MNVNKNRARAKRIFWPIVVNLILAGSVTNAWAEFDFLYEIRGTLDPFVCTVDAPAKALDQIGGLDRAVSAYGIEEATAVGRDIVQNGTRGVIEYVEGGYKVFTDGSPESLNFVVFVLKAAREIAAIKAALTGQGQDILTDAIDNALGDFAWLKEKKLSPRHDPHKDTDLHIAIFKYFGWMGGIHGIIGYAVCPQYLTDRPHRLVGAPNYGNTCPLNATAQLMASVPDHLGATLCNHFEGNLRGYQSPSPSDCAARRAIHIAALNLIYQPMLLDGRLRLPVQRVAVSQVDIAFRDDGPGRQQQDAGEMLARCMTAWHPGAQDLFIITRGRKKVTNAETGSVYTVHDTIRELQVNVPVTNDGEFDIIEAMNKQPPELVHGQMPTTVMKIGTVYAQQYIIVCLNRFIVDQGRVAKNEAPAIFPTIMHRAKGGWKEGELRGARNANYGLRAAILHCGAYEYGHYWAITRRSNGLADEWWYASDQQVGRVDLRDPDIYQSLSLNGYIFLYQRCQRV